MIVKNKKNGTNTLAFKNGAEIVRVILKAGEVVNIPSLKEINQVINKSDFINRGWFEILKEEKILEETTGLDKAKKEVMEYTSKKEKNKQ